MKTLAFGRLLLVSSLFVLGAGVLSYAQSSSGTIRGTVLDPSGAAVTSATVEIQNPVSQYNRSTQTDGQGNFEFDNIPYNPYHLTRDGGRFSDCARRTWTCGRRYRLD